MVTSARGVQGTGGSPASLTISDGATYNYGTQATGSNTDKTFTVTNSGAVSATSVSDGGTLAAPYAYKGGSYPGTGGTCGASVAAAGTCTVVVTYSPSAVGVTNSTLTLNYNNGASGTSTNRALTGTGANPALLTINGGPTYDYGNVTVGAILDHTFTLSNTGGVSATGLVDSGGLVLVRRLRMWEGVILVRAGRVEGV